jgi:hypothetical protein
MLGSAYDIGLDIHLVQLLLEDFDRLADILLALSPLLRNPDR